MRGMHGRSGPSPIPGSASSERRRDAWTVLPAEGYRGRLPTFPLADPSDAERALWRVLWRKPQAVEWARRGMAHQVAAYVRAFLESVEPGANAALKTVVLRTEEGLGLSPVGLRTLRWRIEEPAPEPARGAGVPPVRRLRAVPQPREGS